MVEQGVIPICVTTPQPPLDLPLVTLRHEVASWKIHLLQLVTEAPKATPVLPRDPSSFHSRHNRISDKTASSSSLESSSVFKKYLEACSSTNSNAKDVDPKSIANVPSGTVLRKRRLMEERIASLRLEIGDLSVSENLEKLCDHYFKLDKKGNHVPRKNPTIVIAQEVITSNMTQEAEPIAKNDEITSSTESLLHEEGSEHSEIDCMEIPGYGKLFHGLLTKSQTEKRLLEEGQFLVRQIVNEDDFILSFRFDDEIRNYKVTYEQPEGRSPLYYLEDRKKAYETLEALVQDGLTTMYLDMKAGFYVDIMTELAQINKHDSHLSPTSLSPGSRKNSSVGFSRQVSQRMSKEFRLSRALSTNTSRDSMEMELKRHWFLLQKLEKKTKLKCQAKECSQGSLKKVKYALVCKDCEMIIHEACIELVDSACVPDLSKIPQIFGTDLTTLVKASGGCRPPFVLEKCIQEIEKRGFQSEGIYRVSGYQELIMQFQNSFEKDRDTTDLSTCSDINSICGLVKLFLRHLPEPLITKEVFDAFLGETGFITLDSAKKNMLLLPPAHKITLKYLLEHLQKVAKEREFNKMSPFNLSSVLAPSIIVPEDINLNTLKIGTDVVEVLIKNVQILFD